MEQLTEHKELSKEIPAHVRFINSKKVVSTIKLKPGQKLFEYDIKTGTLEPAEYKTSDVELSGKVRHSVDIKEGSLYIAALNKRNAFKHIVSKIK